MSSAVASRVRSLVLPARNAWPLLLGFAALAIPSAISFANDEWTRDYGGHEPIVLAVSAWLFWRQWPEAQAVARPGNLASTAVLLLLSLSAYVFGRAFDFPTFEIGGLYGTGLAILYACFGLRAIRRLWFPILFVAFVIPPPHALLDALTAPLKELVSYLATTGLKFLGMPVARQGVVIFVAQYQLLVEDACSGLNSLVGLTALSMLYAFLGRHGSIGYSIFLTCLAIPVAIAANVVRVALLVVLTYAFGDAAAQGFAHFAAGIVLFSTALLMMFVIDKSVQRTLLLWRRA